MLCLVIVCMIPPTRDEEESGFFIFYFEIFLLNRGSNATIAKVEPIW